MALRYKHKPSADPKFACINSKTYYAINLILHVYKIFYAENFNICYIQNKYEIGFFSYFQGE